MNIYNDIAERTNGDIYIGVVGPVRTGKSTFIKQFMDMLVIPNIENEHNRERAMDELPQSAAGRMIMTTEPKFIPNEAVDISLDENIHFKVRMIDCVGYVINPSLGYIEENSPRMVVTPWSEEPIPFETAAEIGTQKVINEHSTIGIVVTTDGTITDFARDDYLEAEERIINELKSINKPFIILMNTQNPCSASAAELSMELQEKYGVSVLPVNCMNLNMNDINSIIENILLEFPIKELGIDLPEWINKLDESHRFLSGIREAIFEYSKNMFKLTEAKTFTKALKNCEYIENAEVLKINLADGTVRICINTPKELFYKVIEEKSGFEINSDYEITELLRELSHVKYEYDKVSYALEEVKRKGYGIVSPTIDELSLEEPEIVKQGSRFGVRLKASAPSIHMIRADIETEVSPIVGTEKQSEELVHYLLKEFEVDPKKIWQSNIFGKSLHGLVNEGLHNKLSRMPDDAQLKLQETLQKIINEGSGGLICILL